MTITTSMLISLTAFGAAEVLRQGQHYFTCLAHDAGADGVELRGELQRAPDTELPLLRAEISARGLDVVYSSPRGLWRSDGALDTETLAGFCARCDDIGLPLGTTFDVGNWHCVGESPLAATADEITALHVLASQEGVT